MQENEFNYVRFAAREEIDDYMPLNVTPQPDTIIRVFMVTTSVDCPIPLQEQILPNAPSRNGFTVVEWGGTHS